MFRVKATDGVKIAVHEYNYCGWRTIVLIHGWPLSSKIYEYQLIPLLQEGFHIVAIDLRGFGQSDTPASGYCYDQMATDIYTVVKALKLKRFVLTGFSMGGAVVLRYMKLFCGYGVSRLVLLAAAAPSWTKREDFPYGLSRQYVDELIDQALTDRAQLAYNFSHKQLFVSKQSEAIKNWFEDITLSASGIGTVETAYSLRDEDGRMDLDYVHVPTWIIHGKQDQVVSSELVKIQHECIHNSILIQLENSGHGIMYDELEVFNRHFIGAVTSESQKTECRP